MELKCEFIKGYTKHDEKDRMLSKSIWRIRKNCILSLEVLLLLSLSTAKCADAFTTSNAFYTGRLVKPQEHQRLMQLYLQPPSTNSQTQGSVTSKITETHKNPNNQGKKGTVSSSSLRAAALATGTSTGIGDVSMESAIASSDVLPSFRAAHGLLHPHTFMRLEERYEGNGDDAVGHFLETYREHGPMACIPCLSDPRMLPKLTEAMRTSYNV